MAGIGFVLRKLYREDNLSGLARASLHSAFASTGPWLFTVLALGSISLIGKDMVPLDTLFNFRTILIYNFSFSLVLAAPIFMIATRYLADAIYRRDVTGAPGMLCGALIVTWAVGALAAVPFYFFYARMPFDMALSAVVGFLLLSAVWLTSIFISALKNYAIITWSFLFGMTVAAGAALLLAGPYGATGMLNGFSIGLAVILAVLMGNVMAEYPYPATPSFAFLSYFRKYWEIALGGLAYSMAVWVDKWIMWFSPEATQLPNRLVVYPYYDSAMFIAYLTTIPAMAMFLFSTETYFFERYMRFYRDIEQKAPFAKIQQNHETVARSIFGSAGYFFLLQGCIAALGLLTAPEIVGLLDGTYMQVGMLRYGLIGALFHVLTLFLLVLLSYFDSRKNALLIQLVFLFTNMLFSWGSLKAGFQYYGYGYFMASFITFVVAAAITSRHVARLPYHAFISTNASIPVPESYSSRKARRMLSVIGWKRYPRKEREPVLIKTSAGMPG